MSLTICVLVTLNNKSRFTLTSSGTRRDASMLAGCPSIVLPSGDLPESQDPRGCRARIRRSNIGDKRPATSNYEPDRNTVRRLHRGREGVKANG